VLFPEELEEARELLEGAFEMNILGGGSDKGRAEEEEVVCVVVGEVGRLRRIPELVLALGRMAVGGCKRVAMMERKEGGTGMSESWPINIVINTWHQQQIKVSGVPFTTIFRLTPSPFHSNITPTPGSSTIPSLHYPSLFYFSFNRLRMCVGHSFFASVPISHIRHMAETNFICIFFLYRFCYFRQYTNPFSYLRMQLTTVEDLALHPTPEFPPTYILTFLEISVLIGRPNPNLTAAHLDLALQTPSFRPSKPYVVQFGHA
jgi:hypothetical protein